MIISRFRSVGDPNPQEIETTWEEFASSLEPTREYIDKKSVPCWSPAHFRGSRSEENTVAVSMLVLDIDKQTEDDVLAFASRITTAAVIYTTWSHLLYYHCPVCSKHHYHGEGCTEGPALWCVRACFRLSRPVHPNEWSDFWASAVAFLQAPADGQCKDAPHQYFIPATPPTAPEPFSQIFEGPPLDVDQILGAPAVPVPQQPPEPKEKLTLWRFEKFAKSLARSRQDHLSELGARLLKVASGEAFAEMGERDSTIFRLSTVLAERFHECTPASIAAHFAMSLDLMSVEPDAPTVQDVEYKVRRAQQAILAERVVARSTDASAKVLRIREAFRNGRSEPYQEHEFAPPQRWVLQLGNSYYFWLNGGYEGPYTGKDARSAAVRDLMPAHNVVSLFEADQKGNIVPKPLEALVSEYGTVAHSVIADYNAQKAHYVDHERTIVEAPCPIRPITPAFDPDVAAYLELLGGKRHQDLLTWIAALTVLDRPCAALFIVGPKGAGKSLFAYGFSRIWTKERPAFLDEALADFNDGLLRCPLVFADEQLPRDFQGRARNAELRHFIQAVSRPLNRKFLPPSTLLGATRTVVAANNEEILATPESLSAFDIEAIASRYFYLPASEELCRFMVDKQPRVNGWVDRDRMAAHALWLKENHQWSSDERFIIPPTDLQLHRSLTVRSGHRSAVCQWLVSFIIDPSRFNHDGRSQQRVRVINNKLLVNVEGIAKCWSTYVMNEPCPPTGKLASALSALCYAEREQYRANGAKVNYRVVNIDNLVAWAEQSGYADEETLIQAMLNFEDTTKELVN